MMLDIIGPRVRMMVEAETTSGSGKFQTRPLRTRIIEPEGEATYQNPFCAILDRVGPRILVASGLSDIRRQDVLERHKPNSIVEVDAPGSEKVTLITLDPREFRLEIEDGVLRLRVNYESIPLIPGRFEHLLPDARSSNALRIVLQKAQRSPGSRRIPTFSP